MSNICPDCGHTSEVDAERCERCDTGLGEGSLLDSLGRRLQARTKGRYRIVRRLGSGGMAAVYEAVDSLDRSWAIKVLSDVLLAQPEMVGRFEREARTISRLRHPHIVHLHNFEPHEDLHFLVLEFVPGSSLKDQLNEGPLSLATVMQWFGQIADALDYAHRQGVVHRDIKPDNILIRPTGEAVITDFGIARDETGNTALTRPGTALGTAYYMSPEQWKGQRVDGAADQYSLGVVMWEAVAGRRPFQGEKLTAIMLAHLSEDVPELNSVREGIPQELSAAVARMLSKDPAKRFPSVLEAVRAAGVDALETTLPTRPASTTPSSTGSSHTGPPGGVLVGQSMGPPPPTLVSSPEPPTRPGDPGRDTDGEDPSAVPPTLTDQGHPLTTRVQQTVTSFREALTGLGGGSPRRTGALAAGVAGVVLVAVALFATLGPDGAPDTPGVRTEPRTEVSGDEAGPTGPSGGDGAGEGTSDRAPVASDEPGGDAAVGEAGTDPSGAEAGIDGGEVDDGGRTPAGDAGGAQRGEAGPTEEATANLRLEPAGELRVAVGERRRVTASLVDGSGRPLQGSSPDWDLDDWGIARLGDQSGSSIQVEGVSPGATTLRVAQGPRAVSLTVTVVAEPSGRADADTAGPAAGEEVPRPAEATDVSVALSVGDGALLVAPSLTLRRAAAGTWCVRGEVRLEDGEWVPTEARTAEISDTSRQIRVELPVSFEAMDLPSRGNAERRATARVHLWQGGCEGSPTGEPSHTVPGGRICIVRFLLRDWSAEECGQ